MKIYFDINDIEYKVDFDYKVTSRGCSAHMGSLTYAGHPAEPAEWEIDGDISLSLATEPDKELELPEWLRKQLIDQIYEDASGKITDQIETEEADRDFDYE